MISTTVLSLAVLGQAVLPGSNLSLADAQAKADIIVVAEHTKHGDIVGAGAVTFMGGIELKSLNTLKGTVKDGGLTRLATGASGYEVLPEIGKEYIFFVEKYQGYLTISKILPRTDENIEAVKKEVKAKEPKK